MIVYVVRYFFASTTQYPCSEPACTALITPRLFNFHSTEQVLHIYSIYNMYIFDFALSLSFLTPRIHIMFDIPAQSVHTSSGVQMLVEYNKTSLIRIPSMQPSNYTRDDVADKKQKSKKKKKRNRQIHRNSGPRGYRQIHLIDSI